MGDKRTIGQILQDLGRITERDVARALEHQQANGGYFGESLVALGIVREEELGWSLASQFDLPYVFPDASSVDFGVATLVTPDWALEHVALPVSRSGNRITLVVGSPFQEKVIAELQEKSALEVELALAPPGVIRAVIREVFSKERRQTESLSIGDPVGVLELWRTARMLGTGRWGVSVRGSRAVGWYDQSGVIHRHRLRSGWDRELEEALQPSPAERMPMLGEAEWTARFQGPGDAVSVDVRTISTLDGREILLTPGDGSVGAGTEPFTVPAGLSEEIRLLTEKGDLVLGLRSHPPAYGAELLVQLPGLTLPTSYRILHLVDDRTPYMPEGLTLRLPVEGGSGSRRLEELGEFRFDAVTMRFDALPPEAWPVARRVAPLLFVLLEEEGPDGGVPPEGVEWLLDLEREGEGEGEGEWQWSLETVGGRGSAARVDTSSTDS